MRIWILAAVAVALAGCAPQRDGETISIYVPPPQQHELRPEYGGPAPQPSAADTFGYLLGALAVGYASGSTYSSHHHHHRDDSFQRPTVTHHEPPPPAVMIPGPTYCRPGIGGRGTVCN